MERTKANSGGLGVEIESALQNSGSVAGSMNCPKCGFTQEKRLDCKKCGIVFSKYYALFPTGHFADSAPVEPPKAQEISRQDIQATLSELQAQVQLLSNRFSQVEFEKAERSQLRLDLKNLERQLFENLERMESRLENPPTPEAQQETIDPRLPEILERVELAEAKLGSVDFAGQYMIELSEKSEANISEIADLKRQIALLREDFGKINSQLEILTQAQEVEEPRTPLEEDVHIIRKNLDEFRAFLSKHTAS
jgi:hypothetical protein